MDNDNGHGLVLEFSGKPSSEPIAEQFNGAAILARVSSFIRRYVHLSDEQARIAAVWVAHTHGVTAATTTPYLAVNSATKQSGKTRLLEVFELLVAKPWLTGRVTAACLVRKVDQMRPTLLLDESDAAFGGKKEYAEALRGILNTGFYSGGVASCCVGQGVNISFKDFKTYCAKAIAGIGTLPDTVADRSIPIRLQRKRPGETVARFRRRHAKHEAAEIKSGISDWIVSIADKLKEAEPTLPDELSDRQQDGIEPFLLSRTRPAELAGLSTRGRSGNLPFPGCRRSERRGATAGRHPFHLRCHSRRQDHHGRPDRQAEGNRD